MPCTSGRISDAISRAIVSPSFAARPAASARRMRSTIALGTLTPGSSLARNSVCRKLSSGAIAASTGRIEFGPLVACTAFHNPAVLAKQAATIDEISGGRLILGLGAGWNETEFRAFGVPFDHRVDRFEEAFTIIRTLLQEGAIDFDGRFYQARDCELIPRGPRPSGPPLMIGSNGPRMLRIAVPHAQAWNTWFADIGNTPDGVRPLRDAVDAACRDTGTDPAAIERTVAVLIRFPDGVGRIQGSYAEAPPPPLEGSPEQMADRMRAYAREGVSHIQLVIDPITRGSIEAFAPVLRLLDG